MSHAIVPHMQVGAIVNADDTELIHGSGDWVCAAQVGKSRCGLPLRGTYLRPVIPWEHDTKKVARMRPDPTVLPGLGTTE